MAELTIGAWPSSGETFIIFHGFESNMDGGYRSEMICWTPTKNEWKTLRQIMTGLSTITIPKG
jgi:hypothetical protein